MNRGCNALTSTQLVAGQADDNTKGRGWSYFGAAYVRFPLLHHCGMSRIVRHAEGPATVAGHRASRAWSSS